jgi:parvulin-like peptidyl-prolyl isomerase
VLSEADVRAEYERRKDEFTRPAMVHLLEILIPAELPDAPAVAAELSARGGSGEDFAALAREHSRAPSRAAGGDLGRLELRSLAPAIRRVAETLKPGEVSAPIAGSDGSQRLLKLLERSDEGERSFDEVKAELRKSISDTRFATVYEEYVKGLREKAIVDVRVREVPLQVTVPASSILDPPTPEESGEAAGAAPEAPTAPSEEEFVTSPQVSPEKVVPAGPEPEDKPEENPPR